MAKFKSCAALDFTVTMTLTEKEARALLYLSGFGAAQVASWVIPKVGQSKADDTEEGLISILDNAYTDLTGLIIKIDQVRDLINN